MRQKPTSARMRRIRISVIVLMAVALVAAFWMACICWRTSTREKRKIAAAMLAFSNQPHPHGIFNEDLPASLTERNRQYYTSYLNDPACDVKPGYVAIGYYYRRFGIDYEQDFTLYHRRPDDPTFDFARRHPDDPIWTLMSETKTWLCGRWFSLHERPIAITNTP
jgi:hypothetical protein